MAISVLSLSGNISKDVPSSKASVLINKIKIKGWSFLKQNDKNHQVFLEISQKPTNFHEPTTSKVLRKDIRRDIRKFISDLVKETGTPAKQHKMKDLYDLAKKLARKKSYTSKPLKGTNTVTH